MDSIRISCITWNVETGWPEQDLETLLGIKNGELSSAPDIYLVCLQEVRSQPQNFIMDSLFEEPWTTSFRTILGKHDYVRLTGERLQGIVTSIFMLRKHLSHCRDVHTAVSRTGLAGYWGNKGGVCVRFTLYGCSLCVVNSHLAAHDSGYELRCANYNTIIDEKLFPLKQTSNILYHDYVFWMGDLNFRLTGVESPQSLSKKVSNSDFCSMLHKDELKKAQAEGHAFGPLTEGDVKFAPTYKYQKNSNVYDMTRRPAWTDRVLHQVHVDAYENVKLGVQQTAYNAVQSYSQSDHKPVIANYTIKVFAYYKDRCVCLRPPRVWNVGSMNEVRVRIPADVKISPWDYVAVFTNDFTSTHQYVTYMYMPQTASLPEGNASTANTHATLNFLDELVRTPGLYVLLYYSEKSKSYLGMSEPFQVQSAGSNRSSI